MFHFVFLEEMFISKTSANWTDWFFHIFQDKGTPQSLESQTTVVIDVKDIRDTNPRFLHSSYQTQINENLPVVSFFNIWQFEI